MQLTPSNRRTFLGRAAQFAGAASGALALPFTVSSASEVESWLAGEGAAKLDDPRPDDVVARDETYWSRVRALYDLQANVINLDHGWTNPTPREMRPRSGPLALSCFRRARRAPFARPVPEDPSYSRCRRPQFRLRRARDATGTPRRFSLTAATATRRAQGCLAATDPR